MDAHAIILNLIRCLMPSTTQESDQLDPDKTKLAHYTTAESGLKILRSRVLWLRNATLMNDFSEIQHGMKCFKQSLDKDMSNVFTKLLDPYHPGVFSNAVNRIHQEIKLHGNHTYMTSLSEHPIDRRNGQLSMWRAYGGPISGVAIIFNSEAVKGSSTNNIQTYASKVFYGDPDRFSDELRRAARNLHSIASELSLLPYDVVEGVIFRCLLFLILTCKHQSFIEEQEWRLIHQPSIASSMHVKYTVECLRGIPQVVSNIPLVNTEELQMPQIDVKNVVHQVIVGPCAYPNQVAHAFQQVLRELEIPNANARVVVAEIPLRQTD